MKNYLWTFLLVSLLGVRSGAQEYTPLLDAFNEWQFTTCYFGCLTDVYYTDGDTLVDGVPHKILDGFHYISRTFLLREDVEERKVYLNIVNTSGNSEYLLYDFSLNEGDSFEMLNPITPFPPEGGSFILDSIRLRALIDGNEYRHFYFSPSPTNTISDNNAVWIEGLGSLSLINAPGGDPDINNVGSLSCFFKNGTPFYTNLDSIDACDPVLSVFDITRPLDKIKYRKGDRVNSYIFQGTKAVVSYEIFDVTGKKLHSDILLEPSSQLELSLNGYSAGLYMAVVRSSLGQKSSFKLIIN